MKETLPIKGGQCPLNRRSCPITPRSCCSPVVGFPPSCGLYPVQNCNCQGEVALANTSITIIINGTPVAGAASINAAICPACSPTGSTLTYRFLSAVLPFTFETGFSINRPTSCTIGATSQSLVVSGNGTLFISGSSYLSLPFTLTLLRTIDTIGVPTCSYSLLINSTGIVPIMPGFPTVVTGSIPVPCDQFAIRGCSTLTP